MRRQYQTGKVIAVGAITSVAATLFLVISVEGRRHYFQRVWMDGMIRHIDSKSREITLWDYRSGDSRWDLTVPGSVNLRDLRVGDLVRVQVDRGRRAVFRLHKLQPREDDERYWEAVRRLEAETGSPAQ